MVQETPCTVFQTFELMPNSKWCKPNKRDGISESVRLSENSGAHCSSAKGKFHIFSTGSTYHKGEYYIVNTENNEIRKAPMEYTLKMLKEIFRPDIEHNYFASNKN